MQPEWLKDVVIAVVATIFLFGLLWMFQWLVRSMTNRKWLRALIIITLLIISSAWIEDSLPPSGKLVALVVLLVVGVAYLAYRLGECFQRRRNRK